MLNKRFKKVSIYLAGLLTASVMTGCGKANSTAPNIPTREYTSPTYSSQTEFGPQLPEGTIPTDMVISGLDDKEKESGQILVPVGKIKQLYVDIKLNNGKVLKNYYAVKWSVSNSEVGSVNIRGVFEPKREGRVKVIANIGGVSATVELVVSSALNIWSQVVSPTNNDLYAVKMVNDNEAWAVGKGGTILHYINGNWYNESGNAANGVDLTSVDTTESGEAWAVGGSTIIHYNGSTWENSPYSGGGTLKAIDMMSTSGGTTDGWAVGSQPNGDALVLRFTGGGWQPVETKINEELNTVQALSPSEVWVGGKSRLLGPPAIYRYNGNKWDKARFNDDTILGTIIGKIKPWDGTYQVNSIRMLNSSQGWAVGEYTPLLSSLRGKRGFMFRYDSVKDTWVRGTFDKNTPNLEQVPLLNVGMISGGKGWVLGTNTPATKVFNKEVNDIPGSFLASDGKELKIDTQYQANTVGKAFHGIDILPNGNGIVVGENGFIMQHQYDLSRPNYYSNSGNFNNFNNYGTPSSYQADQAYNGYSTTNTNYR
jgi:hypothetical protein